MCFPVPMVFPLARSLRLICRQPRPDRSRDRPQLLEEDNGTAQLPGRALPRYQPPVPDDPAEGVPFLDTSHTVAPNLLPKSGLERERRTVEPQTPDEFPRPGFDRSIPISKAIESVYQPKRPVRTSGEDERTMVGSLDMLLKTETTYVQFYNEKNREWTALGEIGQTGKIVGRHTFREWDANPEGVAEEHLQIGYDGDELYVEPLESLNGLYRKLQANRHEELAPGNRFRIGRHVMELRLASPASEITPTRAPDGETFQSRVLVPIAFIDLIGPDRKSYLSFPITKREESGTRIGRGGAECDIALAGDNWVSAKQAHARIWSKDGKFWIEDLQSTNGTYLVISGRTKLRRGSAQYPETAEEIFVGGFKIRVISMKG
jgi:pSer/pThr/pTyr-binding forkhead associated (FHA) protein